MGTQVGYDHCGYGHTVDDDDDPSVRDRGADDEVPQRDEGEQTSEEYGPSGPGAAVQVEPQHNAFKKYDHDADYGGSKYGGDEPEHAVREIPAKGKIAGKNSDEVKKDHGGHEEVRELDSCRCSHKGQSNAAEGVEGK